MDATQFDRLTRSLTDASSRRGLLKRLAGAAVATTALRFPGVAAKKKQKTCGPCQIRKKGKCKGNKPHETACNGDGKCFAGTCIPRPTCLVIGSDCTQPTAGECCSGICSADNEVCLFSDLGEPCYSFKDCAGTPLTSCIAYRCR